MDMIDKVMIEDAIKNYRMVEETVHEVAMIVAEMHNTFLGVESPRWTVDKFAFSKAGAGRPHDEDQCHVTLGVAWYDRPATERYGNPDDDDDRDFSRSGERLLRHVTFPTRYLTTLGWRAEEEARARKIARALAQMQVENLEKAIKDNNKRADELILKLEEMRKKAAA